MSRFQGVSMPTLPPDPTGDKIQTEVRKAVLDLLKNDNTLYEELFPTSGSNSNGRWLQLPNGTMFQSGNTAIATNSIATITFPKPFINTTYSFVAIGGRTAGAFTVVSIEVTSSTTKALGSISVSTNAVVGAGGTFNYSWIAFGEWK